MATVLHVAAAAMVMGVLIHLNSLRGRFVMDDTVAVVGNMDLRPETPIERLFENDFWGTPVATEKSHKSFRPLSVLTWRLDYALGGLNPFSYHVGNVVVHGLVCYFLTFFFSVIMPGLRETTVAAMLFAVHPIHTESVASVVGRAEVLSALCYVLALLAYVQVLLREKEAATIAASLAGSGGGGGGGGGCCMYWFAQALGLAACLVLAVVGMLCKEGGLTVLGTCFALEVFVCTGLLRLGNGHGHQNGNRASLSSAAITLLRLGLLVACAAGCLAARFRFSGTSFGPTFSNVDNNLFYGETALIRGMSYAYLHYCYLWQLFVPVHLSCDWSYNGVAAVEDVSDPRNLRSLAAYLAVAGAALAALWHRNGRVLMALALGVVPFIPSSNVLFPVATVLAERLLYLPSMGYCALAALALSAIEGEANRTSPRTEAAAAAGGEGAAHAQDEEVATEAEKGGAAQTAASAGENDEDIDSDAEEDHVDTDTADAKTVTPNGTVRSSGGPGSGPGSSPGSSTGSSNTGGGGGGGGGEGRARVARALAVALVLAFSVRTWLRNADWRTPLALFSSAARTVPTSCKAHVCYAAALHEVGRHAEALEALDRSLAIKPDFAGAHFMMGNLQTDLGDQEAARLAFERTAKYSLEDEFKPDVLATALNNLGTIYMKDDKTLPQARHMLQEAVKVDPERYAAHANLGEVLSKFRLYDEAIAQYEQATQIREVADVHNNWGIAIYQRALKAGGKKGGEAVLDDVLRHYRRAAEVAPNHSNAYHNAGKVLYHRRRYEEAADLFAETVRIAPGRGTFRYDYGLALLRRGRPGDFAAAAEQLRAARDASDPTVDPQKLQHNLAVAEAQAAEKDGGE